MIGEVVKGPIKRTTTTGSTITTLSIRYDKGLNPNSGRHESVIVPIILYAGLGEQMAIMASKGNKLSVKGALNIRYFIDPQKIAHQITEIHAKEAIIIEGTESTKSKSKLKPVKKHQFEQDSLW